MNVWLLTLVGFFAAVTTASAQPAQCLSPDAARNLQAQFGELPVFQATTAAGSSLTVTANVETGSWTAFLQTQPKNVCIVSFGRGWTEAPPIPDPTLEMYHWRDGYGIRHYMTPV